MKLFKLIAAASLVTAGFVVVPSAAGAQIVVSRTTTSVHRTGYRRAGYNRRPVCRVTYRNHRRIRRCR